MGLDVSIPGGFFRGLQLYCHVGIGSQEGWFQSLAGFFVACNGRDRSLPRGITMQSFNPWRVFSWLATRRVRSRGVCRRLGFQSLEGFFVACNGTPPDRSAASRQGFNPWRVFSWLATVEELLAALEDVFVSIPGGFFRGLQRQNFIFVEFDRRVSIPGGFFRGLQPCGLPGGTPALRRFQSLAGFFVACNGRKRAAQICDNACFNPWRVFSWLAT